MILYALVARDLTILAEYAVTSGNFDSIAKLILQKIPEQQDSQMSYVYDKFYFHYIKQDGITYLCLAQDDFPRRRAFSFLLELKQKFVDAFAIETVEPFESAAFVSVMAPVMANYSRPDSKDLLQSDIEQVKNIMVSNIEKVLERGDRIDVLVDRTSDLSEASTVFRKRTTATRQSMCLQSYKTTFISAGVVAVVLYLLVGFGCGFPFFGACAVA